MITDIYMIIGITSLFACLGIKCCELHGDVSQALRYLALQRFRDNEVDIMVATDVAARGLDIPGVQTVLNAEMPRSASTYVHRVGRTARAGCGGRAVTFVGDARRKVMKDVLKVNACIFTQTFIGILVFVSIYVFTFLYVYMYRKICICIYSFLHIYMCSIRVMKMKAP